MLDVAYTLQVERAQAVDDAQLAGLIVAKALGSEVDLDKLSTDGAVASLHRALENRDLEPAADGEGASITELAVWVEQANRIMGGG